MNFNTQFFLQTFLGACIITKLDGNAKGGGALSAVAATQSPVVFYGVGEHIEDFDVFEPKKFVQKLLGLGDMEGLAELMKESMGDKTMKEQKKMVEGLVEGNFTLRMMYEQFQTVMKMGPMGKVMEMIPGMAGMMEAAGNNGQDPNAKLRGFMVIMDSMSNSELDNSDIWTSKQAKHSKEGRVRRIAQGCGKQMREIEEMLNTFHEMAKRFKKGFKGLPKSAAMGGKMNQRNLAQVSSMLPPAMLAQMGGQAGLRKMMKDMPGGMMPGM